MTPRHPLKNIRHERVTTRVQLGPARPGCDLAGRLRASENFLMRGAIAIGYHLNWSDVRVSLRITRGVSDFKDFKADGGAVSWADNPFIR